MSKFIVQTEFYSTKMCKENKDTLYVFGDNLIGIGSGGQAIIRNEPNSFGVATKIFPVNGYHAFLRDNSGTTSNKYMYKFYNRVFKELEDEAKNYKQVVFPSAGLGTGLSRMEEFAPELLAYIDLKVSVLIGKDYDKYRNNLHLA